MELSSRYIITDYIEQAMDLAQYEKLDDGTYSGKIDQCKGVMAFANSLIECEKELRSVLEEWILLGLKLKHSLPAINAIAH
jgi:predicted RNase H-like HicB family nuclease